MDHDWGQVRHTMEAFGGVSNGNRVSLLELTGYDEVHARGVYRVINPRRHNLDVDATRWRMQISARYTF